jgi:hypothetical protein
MYPRHPKAVIAGLDAAIEEKRINAESFAHRLDCRVRPGNDRPGVRRENGNPFRVSPVMSSREGTASAAFHADVRALNRTAVGQARQ